MRKIIFVSMLILSFVDPLQADDITVEVIAPSTVRDMSFESYLSASSELNYQPFVDAQERNNLESQADVSIRGGTFENFAFQLGASSIQDPQTGHYTAELPISLQMLAKPLLQRGFESDFINSNTTAGAISYKWKKVTPGAKLQLAVGTHESRSGELYFASPSLLNQRDLLLDLSLAGSESDGSRNEGDSQFKRINFRLQKSSQNGQTDLFYGRQNKSFSWPFLYALEELHSILGTSGIESEDLRTEIAFFNHSHKYGRASNWEVSAYWRKNRDDYEFDKYQPGLFNQFMHVTRSTGLALSGKHQADLGYIKYLASYSHNDLDSTALVFGDYNSNQNIKLSLVPGFDKELFGRKLNFETGVSYAQSKNGASRFLPLAKVSSPISIQNLNPKIYTSISQSLQSPSYTAINSNPNAGLFRGNKDLVEELTTNIEIGLENDTEHSYFSSAVFLRRSRDVTDWLYDPLKQPFAARVADNIDVNTAGFECHAMLENKGFSIEAGYTYLNKHIYRDMQDLNSFYVDNYAKHRLTLTAGINLSENLILKTGAELRSQQANKLRRSQDRSYFTQALALTYKLAPNLDLNLAADNFWKENFETVPGVPGIGRSVTLSVVGQY